MPENLAYCGLDCSKCDALIATQKKDLERKKEIAKRWEKSLNVKFTPEDINCEGCTSNVISGWCRRICEIRPCAEQKNVETCAHCEDYQCEKLKKFLSNESEATKVLEGIRKSLAI